jgi:hypothetical protein
VLDESPEDLAVQSADPAIQIELDPCHPHSSVEFAKR